MPLFPNKSSLVSGKQLQQQHRFLLRIRGLDVAFITKVDAPSYTTKTLPYTMLDYTFNYPTFPVWKSPINFEIIQVLDREQLFSSLGMFMRKLYDSDFYVSPTDISTGGRNPLIPNALYNVRDEISMFILNNPNVGYLRKAGEGAVLDYSKQKLNAAIGNVEIHTLDEEGHIHDCWRLNNAMITSVKPSSLTYNDEKVSTLGIELTYDWADYGFKGVYGERDLLSLIIGI